MDIGESVRIRRSQLKMTQTDLSRKTGIKQPTISAIENGINKPAIETIVLISEALSCTVSDLIGQTSAQKELDPYTQRLVSIFYQLNDAGKDFLLAQADFAIRQATFRQDASTSSVI